MNAFSEWSLADIKETAMSRLHIKKGRRKDAERLLDEAFTLLAESDNAGQLLAEVVGSSVITVWERQNPKTKIWEHNHISDGFDPTINEPKAMSPTQQKNWNGANWKPTKKYLDRTNAIID